jgi:beta-carotene/zeaxanthin 4-ketolase
MYENSLNNTTQGRHRDSIGLTLAVFILGLWLLSWSIASQIDIGLSRYSQIAIAIAIRTWLYTGLFITTHDAIHQNICRHPWLNRAVGSLCAFLYAGFNYRQLESDHHSHHQHPASESDPDFHTGKAGFWRWYFTFMGRHLTFSQLSGLVVLVGIYISIFHFALDRLFLFWLVPALLSSLQLFYFGTYLPHREPAGGYTNSDRATSLYLPAWLSLITCYHFCYHQEHHHSARTPWWQLPSLAPNPRKTVIMER